MQRASAICLSSEQTAGASLMLRIVPQQFARLDRLLNLVESDLLCNHFLMRMLCDAKVFRPRLFTDGPQNNDKVRSIGVYYHSTSGFTA